MGDQRLILCAAVTLLLAASPAASMGATLPEPPDKLSRRLCNALQTLPETRKAQCCGTSSIGGLTDECSRELGRALKDESLTFDPADVERCAAESARELEGCDWVTPYLPRTPASCRGILRGRLEAGAQCRSSLECRDGLACRGGGPTVPGICVPPGGPGAPCGGAADGLATVTRQTDYDTRHPECTGFCLRGRCVASIALGGECSSDQQCAAGSHCASRRCVEGPRPKLGEACEGTTCDGALACIDGRCSQPKKTGEHCARSSECAATCVPATGDEPGTCGMKCSAWPPAGYTAPVNEKRSDRAAAP